MRTLPAVFALPASLLLLISNSPLSHTLNAQWPYNLPPYIKYFPEDEPIVQRNVQIQKKLWDQTPVGLRKMSDDEGEMFFPEYWQFQDQGNETVDARRKGTEVSVIRRSSEDEGEWDQLGNTSSLHALMPPFPLHTNEQQSLNAVFGRFLGSPRSLLGKRGFQCPTGTSSCASIGKADSCCATGETCQLITDTGLGDVGCCSSQGGCSGQVGSCQQGYTSCPSQSGGGCCIPGYACVDVGCVISSTSTVIVTPATSPSSSSQPMTTTVSAFSSTSSASPSSSSSSIPTSSSVSAAATTSAPASTSTASSSNSCSSGFQSCPASLGGGCCSTDRACGVSECLPLSGATSSAAASTGGVSAAVRPTSGDATITSTNDGSVPTTVTDGTCPTGFYQCSAYYHGGCCRVGRDCALTSCPASDSTPVLNSDGITVLVATAAATGSSAVTVSNGGGDGQGQELGSCAQGWFTCAANLGGGCCPSGYACGGSCTATGLSGSTINVAKETTAASSTGTKTSSTVGALFAIFCIGMAMI